MDYPWVRARRLMERKSARMFFRKTIRIHLTEPLISFTFDDFPRTALFSGGAILKKFDLAGTYYTALGLLGKDSPSGEIFHREDLKQALQEGHELGCHTFSHCHAWNTESKDFERSIVENANALREIVPDASFRSFSYPISEPRPITKRRVSRHFECCRAGGQAINVGTTDLNQLSAYFLEKAKGQMAAVQNLIDANSKAGGWIIFATHDISPRPSPYGCTPEFFEAVVQQSVRSGARVLPVGAALEAILASARS